jgi:hypothetical protein
MRRNSAKLSYHHKVWLYAIAILIYSSGVVWLISITLPAGWANLASNRIRQNHGR